MSARPVAIVTGGARGIGRGCAEALAATGYDIAVLDLSEEKALPMPVGGRTKFYAADMAVVEAHATLVERVAADFGRIDCLVANAGRGALVRWGEPSDIGGVVAALAGGAFHFSTGSVINVDGGLAIPEL